MSEGNQSPDGPAPERLSAVLLFCVAAFVAAVHGAWWLAGGIGPGAARFADGDSYTWLIRAGRLLDGGGWYDTALPRANAPFGGSVHWTRPFDVVLIALAAPLLAWMPAKAALAWAGFLISPLLHIGAGIALVWASRPILGRAAYVAGALSAAQFGFIGYATVGHADHHILLGLAAILGLGCFVRSFSPEPSRRRRNGVAAGFLLAFGLWVGPEILILVGLMTAVAALPWLAGEPDGDERGGLISASLTGGLVIALLIERGPAGLGGVDYDRVSIVYLTLAALLFAFWAIAGVWRRRSAGPHSFHQRLAGGLIGAAAIGAVMVWLFPGAAAGPLAGIDAAALPYLQMASEYRPLSGLAEGLIFLGGALFAIPWLVWRCWAERLGPWRWAWIFVLATGLCFVFLGFHWLRWLLYAGVALAIGHAGLICRADEMIQARFRAPLRSVLLVSAVLGLAVGPAAIGVGARLVERSAEPVHAQPPACDLMAIARLLNRPAWSDAPRTILASANFGAELLYRTPHRVLATLLHRNGSGVVDTIRILRGRDPGEARQLAKARGVDLILLCPGSGADRIFSGEGNQGRMHARLIALKPPAWLHRVALPPELAEMFLLYEVIGD